MVYQLTIGFGNYTLDGEVVINNITKSFFLKKKNKLNASRKREER